MEDFAAERARESLRAILGAEEGRVRWLEACEACGIDHPEGPFSTTALDGIADFLTAQRGPVSLVGNSLTIRLRTFRMLEQAQRLEAFLDRGKRPEDER